MTPEERSKRLAAMRAERRERDGQPRLDPALVEREVAASVALGAGGGRIDAAEFRAEFKIDNVAAFSDARAAGVYERIQKEQKMNRRQRLFFEADELARAVETVKVRLWADITRERVEALDLRVQNAWQAWHTACLEDFGRGEL